MRTSKNYLTKKMPYPNLGMDIFLANNLKNGYKFPTHWHENMQLYYIVNGHGIVKCDSSHYKVSKNSIVIINNNQLHSLESLSDDLEFYTIRIDPTFLFSNQVDLCQTKFWAPLSENRILFQNSIENDTDILKCILNLIDEYFTKKIGYEIAIKSYSYQLIVLLLRNHIDKFISSHEYSSKLNNLNRLENIFKYIDSNYNKKISTLELSNQIHLSSFHFCRLFKQITGKTSVEYINEIRLQKSIEMMKNHNMNITEIASHCGFDNINYFSRLFKKHYKISPSKYRKQYLR